MILTYPFVPYPYISNNSLLDVRLVSKSNAYVLADAYIRDILAESEPPGVVGPILPLV